MRIDLTPLVEQLTREDGNAVWVFEGVDAISPRLYRKGEELSVIGVGRFTELLERELRSGVPAWDTCE